MTSTKTQINYNIQKFNDQNGFGYLIIVIYFTLLTDLNSPVFRLSTAD